MKTLLKYILVVAVFATCLSLPAEAAGLLGNGGSSGGLLTPSLMQLTASGTGVVPFNSLDIGSPSEPVPNGYFRNLFASSTTFVTAGGDLNLGGFQITNAGIVTAANFVATSTTASTTLKNVDVTCSNGVGFRVDSPTFVVDCTNHRVGILTTSPTAAFSVGNTSQFTISSTGAINANGTFTVDTGGSVGASNFKAFAGSANGIISFGSASTPTILTRNLADAFAALQINQINAGSTGDILDLQAGGVTKVAFLQNGNSGFGTTSPQAILSVAGTTTIGSNYANYIQVNGSATNPSIGVIGSSANADLVLNTMGNGQTIFGGGGYTYATAASGKGSILFNSGTTDSPNMKFAYGNNVNFGIDAFNSGTPQLRFIKNSDEAGGQVIGQFDSSGNFVAIGTGLFGTNALINGGGSSYFNGGSLGIGTTSPWRTLSVTGTMALTAPSAFATGDSAVCWRANGEFTVDSGVSSCIVSSRAAKNTIQPDLTSAAFSRIKALSPVTFKYNGSNKDDIGLIAEDVAAIDKRYAQYSDKTGKPAAINWAAITADLIKVVQTQQKRLDEQQKEIDQLNSRLPQ